MDIICIKTMKKKNNEFAYWPTVIQLHFVEVTDSSWATIIIICFANEANYNQFDWHSDILILKLVFRSCISRMLLNGYWIPIRCHWTLNEIRKIYFPIKCNKITLMHVKMFRCIKIQWSRLTNDFYSVRKYHQEWSISLLSACCSLFYTPNSNHYQHFKKTSSLCLLFSLRHQFPSIWNTGSIYVIKIYDRRLHFYVSNSSFTNQLLVFNLWMKGKTKKNGD